MYTSSISNNNTKTTNQIQPGNVAISSGFANVLGAAVNKTETSLDSIFEEASQKYGVPVNLLKAVAKTESNFNANATSSCGAMGIMQLMPATAKALGVTDPYDPEQNIMGGAKYLSQMLKEFGGKTELAVAAYNAGPGNVQKYDGVPPFKETQNYVSKVLGYYGDDINTNIVISNTDTPSPNAVTSAGEKTDINDLYYSAMMNIYMMQIQLLEKLNTDNEKL